MMRQLFRRRYLDLLESIYIYNEHPAFIHGELLMLKLPARR